MCRNAQVSGVLLLGGLLLTLPVADVLAKGHGSPSIILMTLAMVPFPLLVGREHQECCWLVSGSGVAAHHSWSVRMLSPSTTVTSPSGIRCFHAQCTSSGNNLGTAGKECPRDRRHGRVALSGHTPIKSGSFQSANGQFPTLGNPLSEFVRPAWDCVVKPLLSAFSATRRVLSQVPY